MPRNSTIANSTTSRPPKFREVVLLENGGYRKDKKKTKTSSRAVRVSDANVRSGSGTVGGQQYVKVQGFNSVLGGFSGTDLYAERTEACYTFTSAATVNTFKVESLTQFPGFSGFNWLKNISNSYSEYEVHRLEYTYVPSVPTTTSGSIAMSFYTDLRDGTPTDMAQMLSSEQSLMAPVYAGGDGGSFLQRFGAPIGNVVSFELPDHVLRFSNGVPRRFKVTSDGGMSAILGAANGQTAASTYAWGELNVASSGVGSANTPLGTLFVRYRIRLIGPIPIANQG